MSNPTSAQVQSGSDAFPNAPRYTFILGEDVGGSFKEWYGTRANSLLHDTEGFCCVAESVRSRKAWVRDLVGGKQEFGLCFRSSGTTLIQFPGEKEFILGAGSLVIGLLPEGEVIQEFHNDKDDSDVMLLFSVGELVTLLGNLSNDLPAPIYRFAKGETQPFHLVLPMTPFISRAADELACANPDSPLHQLQVRANAAELLWLALEQLLDVYQPKRPSRRLTPKERRLLNEVREVLDCTFTDPPTIPELARLVGIGEEKLCHGFRQLYATTVHGYAQARQMARARELLENSGMPITQIAQEVGYEHATNFTRAFKQYFGAPPRSLRSH